MSLTKYDKGLFSGSAGMGLDRVQAGVRLDDGSWADAVVILRDPVALTTVYADVLMPNWTKVATVTKSTRALRIGMPGSASVFDVEWVSVPAGDPAPSNSLPYGEAILGGEDFPAGLPLGDIYARSASGAAVIVKTGA
ncbi:MULTISPECIES: hypothetical protein [Methylobacterium]|jgi:hypothetical protein|uniref:Uncharacterized protein n=1 Tax=Methylobacterium jeotgali TaxID=381630 RepID=A0ABQ4T191_9HYPH|nr:MULTISPECIES: hypothetical protein [Methylobacterium]PIU05283.1 MAG: hypothetical protein COT56_15970 [Methylobacterium sp. CG09_land_8_20_14_0_10_71_15]PIU12345.1 MAG: hypothetical protein COT28_15250 [Methylobacterium sp. CG08_land_8_20_14_0_20_71_15]GBU16853.1 hypothetical protein AwMethylo_10680 [Methylobacterium sp.]GJE08000.1 hypothetical protein AOPFMNJM_3332 [Methylobacterium jeotgali]